MATRSRLRGRAKRLGRHVPPDWWTAVKVRLWLAWEFIGLSDFFSIGVACRAGRVTLSGTAKNEYRKLRAEETTWHVGGVLGVTNHLEVRNAVPAKSESRVLVGGWPMPAYCEIQMQEYPEEDRALAEAVLRVLSDEGIPTGQGAVRARAVGRTVYLLGRAADRLAAEVAARAALALPQVDRVRSRLRWRNSSGVAVVNETALLTERRGTMRDGNRGCYHRS